LGEGELRTELEALVRRLAVGDHVSMPGFNQNPYAYMASADVFAMSSISEGLPGALIEALACGAPIVSTDCKSGPKEILADGKFGLLVPVGDIEALARGIETQLDAGRSERQAECYRPFTMEAVCDEYLRITSDG
jgi:glycosyltransferase involved in cell wall biosynthesis